MKRIILTILSFIFLSGLCFAEVSARVISIEKEIKINEPIVKVLTEYTYPDGTKKIGTTRYKHDKFTKENVLKDVKSHCETVVQYYIEENTMLIKQKKDESIAQKFLEQNNLPKKERITSITYTLENLYVPEVETTIPASGKIMESYK